MRITILPKTSFGWWSFGLAISSLLLLTYPLLVRLGRIASFIGAHINFAFIVAGIAAFILGIISIIRKRERAILVFLAILIGFFDLIFALGEFIFPH